MDKEILTHRIIFVLILFEIFFLLFLIYGDLTNNGVCNTEGCSEVQNSEFSEIFGIKLIYIALVCFVLLYIFYEKHPKLYRYASTIGAVSAIILIGIQYFIIGSFCRDCLIVDITMIIIFALSVYAGDIQKT